MVNSTFQTVLNFPANRLGRDFVVGDVCGDFELLFRQMSVLAFNPTKDRLFCVGHLIASSWSMSQCIRFVRHPGVYALRTNIEQQLLDLFEEGEPDEAYLIDVAQAFGEAGAWLAESSRAQREQVVDAMRMLPLAMGIGDRQPDFGLVHGSVPMGMAWSEFTSRLVKGDEECLSAALWGNQEIPNEPVDGVSEVFVCYTPGWTVGYERVNIRQVMPGTAPHLLRPASVTPRISGSG